MAKISLSPECLSGNKEVQTIITLSGSIAHELKNYLAAINICAELSEGKLKDIRKKVKDAAYLINNLQLQMKYAVAGKSSAEDFKHYSMLENVREALRQYPFKTNEERDLITIENTRNFTYRGNAILTNHILYNLIKNSLRAIQDAQKGKVIIRINCGTKFNELIFRDTATGIPKNFLPKLFGLYVSKNLAQGGTGLGLAFCKTIMQSYGGYIICNSEKRKYTEFTLKFPCVI